MPAATDVALRDVTAADLPILFEHQLDPDANVMAAFAARDRDAFMTHWTNKVLGDDTVVKQTIVVDGQAAGNIVSFMESGNREVGYWIGKGYWGRGVATRALSQFLELVDARPLYAHVAKHNVGSIRVLEKCGFTISGEDSVTSGIPGGGQVDEFIMRLDS